MAWSTNSNKQCLNHIICVNSSAYAVCAVDVCASLSLTHSTPTGWGKGLNLE